MPEWIAGPYSGLNNIKPDLFSNIDPLGMLNLLINLSKKYLFLYFFLGKGKFGFVFLAKCLANQKHYAIKYIPKQIIFDNQCVKKIQQVFAPSI